MRYDFGRLILGGAYTWTGLFSEFYGMRTEVAGNRGHVTLWLYPVQCHSCRGYGNRYAVRINYSPTYLRRDAKLQIRGRQVLTNLLL